MPRSESRTKTEIWDDDDFRKLTKDAQRMYWLLYSQPTIMLNGVEALTRRRWIQTAADETPEELDAALAELEDHGFIEVDHDTEEVLVRRFAYHDGVKPGPTGRNTVWTRSWEQLGHVHSTALRASAARELGRIGPDPRPKLSTEAVQLSTDDADLSGVDAEQPVENRPPGGKPQVNPPSDGGSHGASNGASDGGSHAPSHGGRARVRAASVPSLRPQSPSPTSVPAPHARLQLVDAPHPHPTDRGDRELRSDRDENQPDLDTPGPSPTDLAHRLANACTANPRIALTEATAVIQWALRYVDTRVIESTVGWAETRPDDSRIALPRAAAGVLARKAHDYGIGMPAFDPRRFA